jgi:hypothetical protein
MIRFDCRGCGNWDGHIKNEAEKLGLTTFKEGHQIVTVGVSSLDELRNLLDALVEEDSHYISVRYKSVTMELLR